MEHYLLNVMIRDRKLGQLSLNGIMQSKAIFHITNYLLSALSVCDSTFCRSMAFTVVKDTKMEMCHRFGGTTWKSNTTSTDSTNRLKNVGLLDGIHKIDFTYLDR